MPPEVEQDVEAQSSSALENEDVVGDIEDMPSDDAESSPAEDVAEDTLSVIQDVVTEENPAGSSPDSEEDPDAQTGDDTADEDADYENLPFGKHPRFQEVLGKVKSAEEKAKQFEDDAGRYRNVEKFIADHGMTGDEAAGGLQVMALAKTNPVEAWNQIKPWVQQLATAAGAILPQNLQQRVQAGELTMETARELAQTEARATSADTQRKAEAERIERDRQTQTQQAIVSSVSTWETERKLRDPNFDAKYNALQREVAFLQTQEGRPKDPNGVADQLNRAYEAVNASFTPPQPTPTPTPAPQPKRAIRPVTGGQSAGNAQAAPESTVDIIRDRMAKG